MTRSFFCSPFENVSYYVEFIYLFIEHASYKAFARVSPLYTASAL